MESETKLEIYPGRIAYSERVLERLGQRNISQENLRLLEEYRLYLISTGKTGRMRESKVIGQLSTICEWIKKLKLNNLDRFTKKDAMLIIAYINSNQNHRPDTKADYRKHLKRFFRWFKDDDLRVYSKKDDEREESRKLYLYLEKEVSTESKVIQADPETIITDDDCFQVLEKGCKMLKESAFISLLHETGCRAGEFLNLRIGDIKLKETLLEIYVPDGKTGKRVIYATRSIPYVLRYIDSHSFKDDKKSFLWISESSTHKNQPLIHIGGQRLISRCFIRARLKKKHNWHWFRHSRATILAPKMTEVMLCKYMGWVIGSGQVKRYVHLCNNQLENVFLSIHGMKPIEEEANNPIRCICGTLNDARERYCYKCFKPLKVEVAIQDADESLKKLSDETFKTMQFFMEMSKKPELMKKFEDFKSRLGGD